MNDLNAKFGYCYQAREETFSSPFPSNRSHTTIVHSRFKTLL